MLIPTFVWEAGRTNRPFPEAGWNKRREEKGLQCSNSWTTVWEYTNMFVWTLSFPLWTSKAIKAEAINAVWWLLLFFPLITAVCTNSDEQISTLNFCVKPEFLPGTSVWTVIKLIRSFNAQSWAVSSPDYRMMLFPNPAVSSRAQVLSWCCLCFSSRGCNSQEAGGVFFWSLLREAFKMKAWREDRRQLIIIWCPKREVLQIRWDFHLWFCCVQKFYWYSW